MIKINHLILLLCISLFSGLFAQKNRKEWNTGKLTWQDFNEKSNEREISELNYFLGFSPEKQKIGDFTVYKYIASAYMDKDQSWVNPTYKTEQYLRYNQVVFDIVEIHRRKLQRELDRTDYAYEAERKFNQIVILCNSEIEKFKKESNRGEDMVAIDYWEQKTLDALKFQPDGTLPKFENKSFGSGMNAGFGLGAFTGTLGEHFTPTFNFIYGFDFAYKKSILFLNGTLAKGNVRKNYQTDKIWQEGQKAGVAIIDASCGYAFIDNNKFKISPFAGLGITEFTATNKDNKENGLRMVDYNMIFGINTDYRIKKRLNLISDSYFGRNEKVETAIRARLYVTKANYFSDLQGYSVNLTIGLSVFGNRITLK